MHRCWMDTAEPPVIDGFAELTRTESDHILKSLRMQTGDPVQLIAAERLYEGEITSVDDGIVEVHILRELPSPEPAVRITLVQGLPKADKMEWIVQKATELGVHSIQPVEMERSVARISDKDAKKRDRLTRIALEAAKQAGRAHVPEVLPSLRLSDAMKQWQGAVYVAWEETDSLRLSHAVMQDQPREMILVVGPEGGITAEEIAQLTAIGAKPVTLGKRILRTETAGLCAIAVTMAALGEM